MSLKAYEDTQWQESTSVSTVSIALQMPQALNGTLFPFIQKTTLTVVSTARKGSEDLQKEPAHNAAS